MQSWKNHFLKQPKLTLVNANRRGTNDLRAEGTTQGVTRIARSGGHSSGGSSGASARCKGGSSHKEADHAQGARHVQPQEALARIQIWEMESSKGNFPSYVLQQRTFSEKE